ncbi:hypothetical protein ELZ88_24290 (plasmid) [Salmonella enterica subsp. enterica serovar Karamoja]|uniref:Uncharacterized protein n=1 Tax=Salmonella enterica subsp. enterica serovar Karamoja TaxID=2500153 RepID=A0A3Q9MQI0_SALET|nr:hypothetical protein [Salmonella enterica]AZT39657.1 hypothetical protein ELZ88_24290 [Salmonella enterica subsp. enterica serovar Karamoja]AZT44447.1 hypothetical protein EL007_24660 [Salmonella enterica subsp. enterica serovar Karamoja]
MRKLFLYDTGSVTHDTLRIMRKKLYTCSPLTKSPDFFWQSISELEDNGIFVLLSHGDNNGPLAVEGDVGKDINLNRFSEIINTKKLTLYLLSCHTGLPPCETILTTNNVTFVAPKGKAVFRTVGDEVIYIYSKNGETNPGWAGSLQPDRENKPLNLP